MGCFPLGRPRPPLDVTEIFRRKKGEVYTKRRKGERGVALAPPRVFTLVLSRGSTLPPANLSTDPYWGKLGRFTGTPTLPSYLNHIMQKPGISAATYAPIKLQSSQIPRLQKARRARRVYPGRGHPSYFSTSFGNFYRFDPFSPQLHASKGNDKMKLQSHLFCHDVTSGRTTGCTENTPHNDTCDTFLHFPPLYSLLPLFHP